MKKVLSSEASHRMRETGNHLEAIVEPIKILPEGEAEFCDYLHSCVCRGNKLCLKGYSEHCQVKRFYDKYGGDYTSLHQLKVLLNSHNSSLSI